MSKDMLKIMRNVRKQSKHAQRKDFMKKKDRFLLKENFIPRYYRIYLSTNISLKNWSKFNSKYHIYQLWNQNPTGCKNIP